MNYISWAVLVSITMGKERGKGKNIFRASSKEKENISSQYWISSLVSEKENKTVILLPSLKLS